MGTSAKNGFVTASRCPTASQTASPSGAVSNLHPTGEVTVWGTEPGDSHWGVLGILGGWELVHPLQFADQQKIECC